MHVINVGMAERSELLVRKALAICGDMGLIINAGPDDPPIVAKLIADHISANGYDLIFCGRESEDFRSGVVGALLSAHLDIGLVSSVSRVEIANGRVTGIRYEPGRNVVIESELPAVISCAHDIASPRVPGIRGILAARNKPVEIFKPEQVKSLIKIVGYHQEIETKHTQFIASDDIAKAAEVIYSFSNSRN